MGTHRRVKVSDLVAYQKKMKTKRRKQLNFLAQHFPINVLNHHAIRAEHAVSREKVLENLERAGLVKSVAKLRSL